MIKKILRVFVTILPVILTIAGLIAAGIMIVSCDRAFDRHQAYLKTFKYKIDIKGDGSYYYANDYSYSNGVLYLTALTKRTNEFAFVNKSFHVTTQK